MYNLVCAIDLIVLLFGLLVFLLLVLQFVFDLAQRAEALLLQLLQLFDPLP